MSQDAEKHIRDGKNASNGKPVAEEHFGEIQLPRLPEHIRMLIITVDLKNDRIQVAGPISHEQWCFVQLDRAKLEISKHNNNQK